MSEVSPSPKKRTIEKMVRRRAAEPEHSPLIAALPDNLTFGIWSAIRRFLGANSEVHAAPSSLVGFGDYCEAAEPDTIFGTFRLSEWGGEGLIAMGPRLVDLAVNTLLGGGRLADTATDSRELTAVDRAIAGRFIRGVIEELAQVFARTERGLGALSAKLIKLESDPRLLTVARRDDAVAKASFEIVPSQRERGGRLDLLLPDAILEPSRRRLRHLGTPAGDTADPGAGTLIEILPATLLTLHAVVDRLTVNLADIAAWQEGTVLPLGAGVGQSVTLYSEAKTGSSLGRQMFVGRLGASQGRKAVRIVASKLEPEEHGVEVLR